MVNPVEREDITKDTIDQLETKIVNLENEINSVRMDYDKKRLEYEWLKSKYDELVYRVFENLFDLTAAVKNSDYDNLKKGYKPT